MSNTFQDVNQHIKWFRDSSPYIRAHRGKTFVIYLSGEVLDHPNLIHIVGDLILLNSLGVKLILVHGAASQINRCIAQQHVTCQFKHDVRITTVDILPMVLQAIGQVRLELEAILSKGMLNFPEHQPDLLVASGNYVKAMPMGIIDGQDFQHTGKVRKINIQGIKQHLGDGALVLISPTGYSPSGEIFNINSASIAGEVASAMTADKLILFTPEAGVQDPDGKLINELQVNDIDTTALGAFAPLRIARDACRHGVSRCHLLSDKTDGALLEELLTRNGSGTQIVQQSYESIRPARPEDVAGIINLIEPLEQRGILVKRSRELIEAELEQFVVIDRDGMIVSCAALYPFSTSGELACLVTHPDYRNNQRGELLLKAIEEKAHTLGLNTIFVLTTHTTHWFIERGFTETELESLPASKQSFYNYQRNSKLFIKATH